MIQLKVISDRKQQFTVSGDEPFRVECQTLRNGRCIAHVYRGSRVIPTQEPIGCYDGTNDKNRSWKNGKKVAKPVGWASESDMLDGV